MSVSWVLRGGGGASTAKPRNGQITNIMPGLDSRNLAHLFSCLSAEWMVGVKLVDKDMSVNDRT